MTLAFLNGRFVPAAELMVPVYDAGFVMGATVAEQLRTFAGRLFRLDDHLRRLARSLEIVGVDSGISMAALADAANELTEHNHRLLAPGDDLGLTLFVTPGPYPAMAEEAAALGHTGPLVGMHTRPLAFHQWSAKYDSGEALVVTPFQQVPVECWPAELKCRSRMHYYLADRFARQTQTGARALLLDAAGHVLESSTANILVENDREGIVSPPRECILPGVSVHVIEELAAQLGIAFGHRHLRLDDLLAADEVLLCSTSPCVWPVRSVNGQPIGSALPGPTALRLRQAWSDLVGLDIRQQARQFSDRQAAPGRR